MTRPRRWTDDQLCAAISGASSWSDVVIAVGRRPSGQATTTVQGHALRLGIDVSHLSEIPPETPVLTDLGMARCDRLAAAVEDSSSWAEVVRKLGYGGNSGSAYATVKRVAARLGLDTSHLPDTWNSRPLVPRTPLPFARQAEDVQLRAAAVGQAVAWFLHRGYIPSLPVEPTRYDIVVESDEGLKRIQVKSTTHKRHGRYVVMVSRMEYGVASPSGRKGRRSRVAYALDEVDYFFIVTGARTMYLIPADVVNGAANLVLDRKYAAYQVR